MFRLNSVSFNSGQAGQVDIGVPLTLHLKVGKNDFVISPLVAAASSPDPTNLFCIAPVASGNGNNIGIFALGKDAMRNLAVALAAGGKLNAAFLLALGRDDSKNYGGAAAFGGKNSKDLALGFADGEEGSEARALGYAMGAKGSKCWSLAAPFKDDEH